MVALGRGFPLETRPLSDRRGPGGNQQLQEKGLAPGQRKAGVLNSPEFPELLIQFSQQDVFSSPHTFAFRFLLTLPTYYQLI